MLWIDRAGDDRSVDDVAEEQAEKESVPEEGVTAHSAPANAQFNTSMLAACDELLGLNSQTR